jgi:hypothetical protein
MAMHSSPKRHAIRRGLVAALLGLCACCAAAAPIRVPPLVQPASQERHVGKVIFVELVTPDLGAAKSFYGQLFDWTFRDIQADGFSYAQASLDGQPVAGLVGRSMPSGRRLQPTWLGFMSVRDVDAAGKAALDHGGRILFAPHNVAGRGREAVLADPQGAVFAVLDSSSGDPAEELASTGAWIWSSLSTADPDTDAAFYQAVFDYEVFDLQADDPPAEGLAEHLLLASDNYARASANSLPTNRLNEHPYWLNYIRVEDTEKTAARVVALGGRVLVEPRLDRHGGKIAVVADPMGAAFGLIEWADAPSGEVTK